MDALNETQLLGRLVENFRLAAEDCDALAVLPAKGPTYDKLRKRLKVVEDDCRMVGSLRADARWLQIGLMMAATHRMAGDWLRGLKGDDGIRRRIPAGTMHPLFVKLAENLRAAMISAQNLRTKATGRTGPILPKPLPAPTRTQGRQIQVLMPEMSGCGAPTAPIRETTVRPQRFQAPRPSITRGGIILPAGVTVQ